MIFSLELIRARKGDCLLLHYGTPKDPGLMLIDGGPSGVYKPHLRPRLNAIRKARGLASDKPLPIDLLMVSHVDDDHIRGILDLTSELREAVGVPFVQIANFWHNTFDDVIGKNPRELTAAVAAQFGAAALSGNAIPDIDDLSHDMRDTFKILASIEQGHRLRGDITALGATRNIEFDEKLILASTDTVEFDAGLTFIVAGPMKPEVLALQKKHDEWLSTHKEDEEDVEAAYVDKSIPNLSSIVVFAQCDEKSMLLTGDARGDKILKGLELAEVLKPGEVLEVDILKGPHHGSSNNLDTDFFERIIARHYVFSGDGEHGNPERETLEMLLNARGKNPFTIHLTYPVADIDVERRKDWVKEQNKELARAEKGSSKPVRENWSPKNHSVEALLEQRPLGRGQRIVVNDDASPHLIELLDAVGS